MSNSESSASHSQSFVSGRKNQESIMNEYKRLCMDQESFYFSIDPISYSPLPKFLPKTISKQHTHSIYLQNCTFYEMFTFAIFEHLILNPTHKKQQKIEKFKKLVCSNNFLTYAGYIKGLILKGLKSMIQSAQSGISKPVAQVLMGSEKMSAFCECWKEMIFYFNRKGTESEDEINSSMIELFTNFFQVEINFITKKGKQFQKEIIGTKTTDRNDVITIVLISNSFDQQEEIVAKQHSFSQISSIYGNWSYHILLSYPQISKVDHEEVELPLTKRYPVGVGGKKKSIVRRETIKMDYPQLFAIDEQKSQAAQSYFWQPHLSPQLIRNARQTLKKGDSLISTLKKFTESLCSAQ